MPVLLNFIMNDQYTGPAWNVLMWAMLTLGQGIQVSLYSQEWYAQRQCPPLQVRRQPPPCPSSQPRVGSPSQQSGVMPWGVWAPMT